MPVLHAARALTPEGWKSDVRVTIEEGAIAAVETGAAAREGDERHAIMAPAAANLHSHAFQRAMAGLAEIRGREIDTFWTWRETMYRFALQMSPDDVEAVAAQALCRDAGGGVRRASPNSTISTTRPTVRPMSRVRKWPARILAAARRTGIGMTLLPVFYAHSTFGGAPPEPEQRRFVNDVASFARLVDDCRRMVEGERDETIGIAPHSLRAVSAGRTCRTDRRLAGDGPDPHPRRRADQGGRGLRRLVGRPAGAVAHRPCGRRRKMVPRACDPHGRARDARPRALGRGRRPLSGDRGQPWRRHLQCGGLPSRPAGAMASAPTRMSASASRRSCASSNMRRGCASGRAMSALRRVDRTGRAMLEAIWSGGAQALRRRCGRLAPGASADILTFRADHPTLAGKDGRSRSSTPGSSRSGIGSWIASGAAASRSSSTVATCSGIRSRRDSRRRCAN